MGETSMVITVLEARVEDDRVAQLQQSFREATRDLPYGIVETFLVRDAWVSGTFRIVTLWRSLDVLEKMRAQSEKPKGVQIFEPAGASPSLTIAQVLEHHAAS